MDFTKYSAGGKPTVYPIVRIILARGVDAVREWIAVVTQWDFTMVIPAHLDAPLRLTPDEFFAEIFDYGISSEGEAMWCGFL